MKFKSWFSSKRIFKIRGPQSSGICLKPALVSGVRMRLKQQQRWRETNSTVLRLDRTSCSDGYLKHFTSFSLAWEDWTKYTIHIFGKPRVCHCCHHHMQTFDQRNVYSDKSGVHFVRRLKKKWVNEGGGSHKGEDRLTSCAGTRCLYSTWNPRNRISHPPCTEFDSLQTCSIRLPFPTKTHRESNQ